MDQLFDRAAQAQTDSAEGLLRLCGVPEVKRRRRVVIASDTQVHSSEAEGAAKGEEEAAVRAEPSDPLLLSPAPRVSRTVWSSVIKVPYPYTVVWQCMHLSNYGPMCSR